MVKIAKYNRMTVVRLVDFGAYLADDDKTCEILLPAKYIKAPLSPGDEIDVFVYRDSEDRPIATTLQPKAVADTMAYLEVVAVNDTGAFLDWGLEKDLLVPYREQKVRMRKGGIYPVYLYVDNLTGRAAATARYEKYIDNTVPEYKPFQKVTAFITGATPLGYRAVVNNRHTGLVYSSEVYRSLETGDTVDAYVRKVREDGKIDLTLLAPAADRIEAIARKLLERIERAGGALDIGDHTSPEYINAAFGCSKKDFKKAIGYLLKRGKVEKTETGLSVLVN